MKKRLRPYQQQAVYHTHKRLQEGCRRMYITLPTGTGKSAILAALAESLLDMGRVLVLIHRQDIANQLATTLREEGLDVGLLMQGHRMLSAAVTVAITQSLSSLTLQDLLLASDTPIATIFIDEAHHAVEGSTYGRIIAEIEQNSPQKAIPVIGFTATPYRSDKQSMLSLLPTCAFARDIPDMVRDGWLAPLTWKPLRVDIDLSQVRNRSQDGEDDYDERALSMHLARTAITEAIARKVVPLIGLRPTLVFAASVEHAEQLAEAFCQCGIAARALSGRQSRSKREQVFAQWRAGKIQMVCNCSLLTEGFDFPEIAALVIARPTRSPSLYMQMLGRGTRLAPDKQDCLVLDVMGNDPDPARQVVLPQVVGDIQAESGAKPPRGEATDPLLKTMYGTDKPSLSLLDPIGLSHYRWSPYQLGRCEGYFSRISRYERAIIERDPEGSGLYRSRLYTKQPEQQAEHQWIEYRYLPLRQQVALTHEATGKRYVKKLGGKEARWLHEKATENQLRVLQRLNRKAAQRAREKAWTGQMVSDLITFLPMRGTLTNPPSVPTEERDNDVV
jgi:superfamily II DNA or RNA helicase